MHTERDSNFQHAQAGYHRDGKRRGTSSQVFDRASRCGRYSDGGRSDRRRDGAGERVAGRGAGRGSGHGAVRQAGPRVPIPSSQHLWDSRTGSRADTPQEAQQVLHSLARRQREGQGESSADLPHNGDAYPFTSEPVDPTPAAATTMPGSWAARLAVPQGGNPPGQGLAVQPRTSPAHTQELHKLGPVNPPQQSAAAAARPAHGGSNRGKRGACPPSAASSAMQGKSAVPGAAGPSQFAGSMVNATPVRNSAEGAAARPKYPISEAVTPNPASAAGPKSWASLLLRDKALQPSQAQLPDLAAGATPSASAAPAREQHAAEELEQAPPGPRSGHLAAGEGGGTGVPGTQHSAPGQPPSTPASSLVGDQQDVVPGQDGQPSAEHGSRSRGAEEQPNLSGCTEGAPAQVLPCNAEPRLVHGFTFVRPGGLVVRHQLPPSPRNPTPHPEAVPPAREVVEPLHPVPPGPPLPAPLPAPGSFPPLPHMPPVPMLAPAWAAHAMHAAVPTPAPHGAWARPHPGVMLPPPLLQRPPPGVPPLHPPHPMHHFHALPPAFLPGLPHSFPRPHAVPTGQSAQHMPDVHAPDPAAPPFVQAAHHQPAATTPHALHPAPTPPEATQPNHVLMRSTQGAHAATPLKQRASPPAAHSASQREQPHGAPFLEGAQGTGSGTEEAEVEATPPQHLSPPPTQPAAEEHFPLAGPPQPAGMQIPSTESPTRHTAKEAVRRGAGSRGEAGHQLLMQQQKEVTEGQRASMGGGTGVVQERGEPWKAAPHDSPANHHHEQAVAGVGASESDGGATHHLAPPGGVTTTPSQALESHGVDAAAAAASGMALQPGDHPVAAPADVAPAGPKSWAALAAAAGSRNAPLAHLHRRHPPQRLPGQQPMSPGSSRARGGGRHQPSCSHYGGPLQHLCREGRQGRGRWQEHDRGAPAGRGRSPHRAQAAITSTSHRAEPRHPQADSARQTRPHKGADAARVVPLPAQPHSPAVEPGHPAVSTTPSQQEGSSASTQIAPGAAAAVMSSSSQQQHIEGGEGDTTASSTGMQQLELRCDVGGQASAAAQPACGVAAMLKERERVAQRQPPPAAAQAPPAGSTGQESAPAAGVEGCASEGRPRAVAPPQQGQGPIPAAVPGQAGAVSAEPEAVPLAEQQAAAPVGDVAPAPAGGSETVKAALGALQVLCCLGTHQSMDQLQAPVVWRRVQPRGLLNPGNLCFMNCILQALMGAGQFCHVLCTLRAARPVLDARRLPTLTALADLALEFEPAEARAKGESNAQGPKPGRVGGKGAVLLGGQPLMPSMLMTLVNRFHQPFRRANGGSLTGLEAEQQDASEFLDFLVDSVHQEMVALRRMQDWQAGAGLKEGGDGDSEDGWLTQSGKRAVRQQSHKSVEEPETAFSALFRGRQESSVACAGVTPSVTITPFTAVHLHIHQDKVRSVVDALDAFSAGEPVHGYKPSAQAAPVVATKTVKLASLPTILVLHLMRFEFGRTGSAKVSKHLSFDANLMIKSSWLSKASKDRGAEYELVATVSHHGKHSSQGHYTADVQQLDGQWLRFDDGSVFVVDKQTVLSDRPYLLFYQRVKKSRGK